MNMIYFVRADPEIMAEPMTYPDGALRACTYNRPMYKPKEECYVRGHVAYDRKLEPAEIEHFHLIESASNRMQYVRKEQR